MELMPVVFFVLICSKLVCTSSAEMYHTLCVLVGAFPVEFSVEIVLQKSVFLKLGNYLLISNPLVGQFSCNTVSKLLLQTVLTGSTGVTRHMSKSNRLVMLPGPLKSAPKESSPIKTVSVNLFPKSRSSSKNVVGVFFKMGFTTGYTLFACCGQPDLQGT